MSDSVNSAVAAEAAATKDQAETDIIIINPPRNLAVHTTPLYIDAGGSVVAHHQYSNKLVTVD